MGVGGGGVFEHSAKKHQKLKLRQVRVNLRFLEVYIEVIFIFLSTQLSI